MRFPMKLRRRVPARIKTLRASCCRKGFLVMSEEVRAIRRNSSYKMTHCYWCRHEFKNGDPLALAMTEVGNKVLCEKCADELLASNDEPVLTDEERSAITAAWEKMQGEREGD